MIAFTPDIFEKIGYGIKSTAQLVQLSYGPKGKNIAFKPVNDVPYILSNADVLIKNLNFEDHLENVGYQIIKQVMDKTYQTAGDGSGAAAILTAAIWENGIRNISAGNSPSELARGIRKAALLAADSLNKQAIFSSDSDTVYYLAKTACKGRDDLAKIVRDIFDQIGINGYIHVSDSQLCETVININHGIRWEQGFSSYEDKAFTLTNPLVLIINKDITDVRILFPAFTEAKEKDRDLLIICKDLNDDVRQAINYLRTNGGINVIPVCAPGHGEVRDSVLRDFGVIFFAKVYDDLILNAEGITASGLGVTSKAVISRKETVLTGAPNAGDSSIQKRRISLFSQLAECKNEDERYRIESMLLPISENTAEILVGGTMEMEMFEKKYLLDHAVRSVFSGLRNGYLPGGAKGFLAGSDAIEKSIEEFSDEEQLGAKIMAEALKSPIKHLSIEEADEDLIGVFDSLESVKTAVLASASAASEAITLAASIT